MVGVFNFQNFTVHKGNISIELSKSANIPYSRLEYGRKIQQSERCVSNCVDAIYSSFGEPSFKINDAIDGPVDCWVISSLYKHEIIYIEHWKFVYPQRMYVFINILNYITSSFIKSLYERVL